MKIKVGVLRRIIKEEVQSVRRKSLRETAPKGGADPELQAIATKLFNYKEGDEGYSDGTAFNTVELWANDEIYKIEEKKDALVDLLVKMGMPRLSSSGTEHYARERAKAGTFH